MLQIFVRYSLWRWHLEEIVGAMKRWKASTMSSRNQSTINARGSTKWQDTRMFEFPYAANNLWTYVDITRTTWGFQQPKDFLLAANKIPRWGLLTVVCIGSVFRWVRWLLAPLILKDFHFVLGCGDARFSLEQLS